jgi:nucleoside recognition membrane protein YjiH
MMIKRIKWCMVLMFITIGCFAVDTEDEEDRPPYIEHVVAIFRDAANQIEKELGLECIGSGGAMPFRCRKN